MDVDSILFFVLKVIAAVAIALITKYVIPALKTYIEANYDSQLFDFIETAVRAAEQTITESGKGEEKRKQVEEIVTAWANKKGIDFTYAQLDQWIEECVYLLANQKGKNDE